MPQDENSTLEEMSGSSQNMMIDMALKNDIVRAISSAEDREGRIAAVEAVVLRCGIIVKDAIAFRRSIVAVLYGIQRLRAGEGREVMLISDSVSHVVAMLKDGKEGYQHFGAALADAMADAYRAMNPLREAENALRVELAKYDKSIDAKKIIEELRALAKWRAAGSKDWDKRSVQELDKSSIPYKGRGSGGIVMQSSEMNKRIIDAVRGMEGALDSAYAQKNICADRVINLRAVKMKGSGERNQQIKSAVSDFIDALISKDPKKILDHLRIFVDKIGTALGLEPQRLGWFGNALMKRFAAQQTKSPVLRDDYARAAKVAASDRIAELLR